MTDLTEKWKSRELKSDWYYVYLKCLDMFDIAASSTLYGILERGNEDSTEVIAPVPSYQEWQETLRALDAARKAIKMEDETINRLVSSGKQCNYKNAQLKEENAKLKDIISKMCMELVAPDDDMSSGLADYFNQDLISEIHEVLK